MVNGKGDEHMIEECNFKSKIRHPEAAGCHLTPNEIVCPGEEHCILYRLYKNSEQQKGHNNR